MNPTPERALELADALHSAAESCLPRTFSEREQRIIVTASQAEAVAVILRAYADLSQKWQSVLDAEPVAEVSYHRFKQLNLLASSDDVPSGTQLIIKPTE